MLDWHRRHIDRKISSTRWGWFALILAGSLFFFELAAELLSITTSLAEDADMIPSWGLDAAFGLFVLSTVIGSAFFIIAAIVGWKWINDPSPDKIYDEVCFMRKDVKEIKEKLGIPDMQDGNNG